MPSKANASRPKGPGKSESHNPLDRGRVPSPKGGPRKAGETPKERCELPEPRRKLDAGEVMSETPTHTANGTAGRDTDWTQVNWRQTYKRVRNLRQRIFRATQEGDYRLMPSA